MIESLLLSLKEQTSAMEWIAVVFSLLYVFLAARENIWCWLFGALSAAISVLLFVIVKLYAESILYVFYVVISIYGWWQWTRANQSSEQPIVEWGWKRHTGLIAMSLLGAAGLFFVFSNYSDAEQPLLDALTTHLVS